MREHSRWAFFNSLLKSDVLFTLRARYIHHVPDNSGVLVSANTADSADDLVKLLGDRGSYPPTAGAQVIALHGLQRRPAYFSKFFPVVGTPAVVHRLIRKQTLTVGKDARHGLTLPDTENYIYPTDLVFLVPA